MTDLAAHADEIIVRYTLDQWSIGKIAVYFDALPWKVRDVLVTNGVTLRPSGRRRGTPQPPAKPTSPPPGVPRAPKPVQDGVPYACASHVNAVIRANAGRGFPFVDLKGPRA